MSYQYKAFSLIFGRFNKRHQDEPISSATKSVWFVVITSSANLQMFAEYLQSSFSTCSAFDKEVKFSANFTLCLILVNLFIGSALTEVLPFVIAQWTFKQGGPRRR